MAYAEVLPSRSVDNDAEQAENAVRLPFNGPSPL